MSTPIQIIPYDKNWPALFAQEAIKIKKALGENCLDVHHIGSTSIPGLAAKPIIDIIPVVKNILTVEDHIGQVEELGYEARGEYGIPFRRFFQKGQERRTHHLHIYEEGNPEIDRHLKFKEYMIHNPDALQEYAQLKIGLAAQFANDPLKYGLGKEQFIEDIDDKAGFDGVRMVQVLTPKEWQAYHHIQKTQIYEPHSSIYSGPDSPQTNHSHCHMVFRKGIKIIGAAHIEFLENENVVIRTLAIDQNHQLQGLGRQFLSLLERWFSHQQKRTVYLYSPLLWVKVFNGEGYKEMPLEDAGVTMSGVSMGKILTVG